MRATCHREGLLSAFQVAAGVVPQRSPRAILGNTKIEFSTPDKATLLATDLELGIRYQISGINVSDAGQVVLPVGQTIAILRELSDDTVELKDVSGGVMLQGASSRFELSTEDPLQFPDVPGLGDEVGHKIKAGVLVQMIRRTAFACAAENSRYALHSVLLQFDEGRARLVATDSKRLALMPGSIEVAGPAPEGSWLLAPKSLQLLLRVLQDPEEEVSIVLHENDALFQTPKMTVYTRLVEGRFPRYQDVMPTNPQVRIPLPIGPFHSVVRQSKIVTNDESRGVDFFFGDGSLLLRSRAPQMGQSEVRMPVGYDGPPLELTYDPQLLMDALKVLDQDEELTLELVDTRKASIFRTGDDYAYVVMPLIRDG